MPKVAVASGADLLAAVAAHFGVDVAQVRAVRVEVPALDADGVPVAESAELAFIPGH